MDSIYVENEDDITSTINFYEEKIHSNSDNINDFINLSFIYWAVASGEIIVNNELSLIGYHKYNKILDKGLIVYPNSRELHFWKKYFPNRLSGDVFSFNDCNRIINDFKDENEENNLVPFFFLNFFDQIKYENKINLLRKICLKKLTLKNKYILNYL